MGALQSSPRAGSARQGIAGCFRARHRGCVYFQCDAAAPMGPWLQYRRSPADGQRLSGRHAVRHLRGDNAQFRQEPSLSGRAGRAATTDRELPGPAQRLRGEHADRSRRAGFGSGLVRMCESPVPDGHVHGRLSADRRHESTLEDQDPGRNRGDRGERALL